jgi:Skp family chaperone for outer membrane proteins
MKKILILLFFLVCVPFAGSVEIQLDKARSTEEKPEMNVGYVDVNALFEEHPMTVRLKEDFLKEADKRKQIEKAERLKLDALENVFVSSTTEVKQLRQDIENIKKNQNQPQFLPQSPSLQVSATNQTRLLSPAVSTSSITVSPEAQIKAKEELIGVKEKAIAALKNDIEKKKLEMSGIKKKHRVELEKLEANQSEMVIADLDQVIEEVAKEENLTVILDKSNILYGKTVKNVTDKVRQRLRGR